MAIDLNKGFVAFPRGLTSWEWYDDANTCRLFFHLLLTANWAEAQWRGITIHPGQLVTSQQKLAECTGLTRMQVRTAILNLKSTNCITISTTSKFSIITINNYMSITGRNQPDNQQITSKQPADNHNHTIKTINTRITSSSSSPSGDSADGTMTTTTPESFWVSSGLGKRCSPALKAVLEEYRSAGIEDALILQAMRETAEREVRSPYPYLRAILDKAVAAGQLTLGAWQAGRRPGGDAKPRVDRETPSGNDFLKNAGRRRPLKKTTTEKGDTS